MIFDKLFVKEETPLEREIKRIKSELEYVEPDEQECIKRTTKYTKDGTVEEEQYENKYSKLLEHLERLQQMDEKEKKPKFEVSGDTIVKCACYVGIGVLIVFHEQLVGPVASKALKMMTIV